MRSPARCSSSRDDDPRAIVCRAALTGVSASTVAYKRDGLTDRERETDTAAERLHICQGGGAGKAFKYVTFSSPLSWTQAALVRPAVGSLSST